ALVALIVAFDAVGRVGEPDGPVRFHHDVVGRVERLAVVAVGEHRDLAVVFCALHAAIAVGTGYQPSLTVAGVAIGVPGRSAERRHADARSPTQDAVVGDVAPEQVAAVSEPDGPLGPATVRVQRLELRTAVDQPAEFLLIRYVELTGTGHVSPRSFGGSK